MKKITEIAIKRPLLITVCFAVLLIFGAISYNKLSYNLLPKFDANVLTISTTYRGASAEEIENTVTKKIEDAIASMEGIDNVTASSIQGLSTVTISLKQGIDVNYALSDADRKVNQILNLLPLDIDKPSISKFSSDDSPVLRISTTSNLSPADLYDIMDKQIKPQLANIEGVGQINLIGGNERQINVNINKEKLEAYKLNVSQVVQAINNASLSSPAGNIETTSNNYSIKYDAKFSKTTDMANLIVTQNSEGGKVYLKDVAEVVDGVTDVTIINHFNGVQSLGLQVLKQSDANAVDVSKGIKKKLDELETSYKTNNLKFSIASDQSTYTLSSANAVVHDLVLAVIIVALVMLFFLHSLRSSVFVLVALPASMIPVFVFMYLFGMSLNLMTLVGLTLVVGILVDDSIVILENITHHMELGKDRVKAAIDGRAEIGFTAIAITLVDVVVFVPLSFAGGTIGNILREFALVVVMSTLMSLLVSFTITPLLSARYGRLIHLSDKNWWGRLNLWFESVIVRARDGYTNVLRWSLKHKRWVLGSTIIIFFSSLLLVGKGFIGSSFISKSDNGELSITLEMAPQTSVYQTNIVTQQVEKILFQQPETEKVFSNVGYSSTGGFSASGSNNSNKSEVTVILVDKEKRKVSTDEFGLRIKKLSSQIPGVKITVAAVGITGGASAADIQLVVKSQNRDTMKTTAAIIKDIIAKIPGTQYVKYSTADAKPEINIQLDREKVTTFGLNAQTIGSAITSAFSGNNSSRFTSGGNEYDIMVMNDKFDKSTIEDVRKLQFTNSAGSSFQLSQFADITETMGESNLERKDRLPSITINASVIGRSAGTVGGEIEKQVNELHFPGGVSWEFTGNLKNQSDAFASLAQALLLGILLVYLIMVALYENAIYPFVVLFALPLALIGALLALALTMNELTIFSIIGFIMLMGLVAKNAILLVDFTNQQKAEGIPLVEALVNAGKERFRPILMTTIAMIVGMLPVALAGGSGAEVKNGMAWVIIGGLTSSLLLTLVVVPSVYYIVDRVIARFKDRQIKQTLITTT